MSYLPPGGFWLLARAKVKYYGAYPAGFLDRARLFLGIHIDDPLLHVCGGKVREYPFANCVGPNDKTVDLDIRLNPDYLMDVRFGLPMQPDGSLWPSALVDAPYSELDAEQYACGREAYPQPNPLLKITLEHVRPGGRVGFLHPKWPRPPKLVHGCRIKEVWAGAASTGRDSIARHYVVFEKIKP